MKDTQALTDAVRSGELSFETALEEALGDFEDSLDDVYRILGYFNLGDRDRIVDVGGVPENVGEFVARHGLQPFVALLNELDGSEFSIGDVVAYGGSACRILGRRAVSPFAVPRYDDHELLLESLESGTVGFVGEGEVEALDDEIPNGA
jgi:hypothetical protein